MINSKKNSIIKIMFILALFHLSDCRALFTENELEEIQGHIRYTFRNPELLKKALIHPSKDQKNEEFTRLAFVGDAVIKQVVRTHLYDLKPSLKVGELNPRANSYESEATLSKVARNLIGTYIKKGKDDGDRIYSESFEALVGAIHIDKGDCFSASFLHKYLLLPSLILSSSPSSSTSTTHAFTPSISPSSSSTFHSLSSLSSSTVSPSNNNNNNNEDVPMSSLEKKSELTTSLKSTAKSSFANLKEFRKLCQYKTLNLPQYYEVTIKVGEKTFTAGSSSKKKAKSSASKKAYEGMGHGTIGKKKAAQALEKKAPQVSYLPAICKTSTECEVEANYNGRTAKEKGNSLKEAKKKAAKKLYEQFKS